MLYIATNQTGTETPMRVVKFDDIEWTHHENAHRGGGLKFKNLLEGVEGTPENFYLTVAAGDGHFFSPRHKHNFDQFRLCLKGRTSIDPKKYLVPGEVGYFPEGTSYGPQQDSEENLTMVLQFGAASGSGYASRTQVRRAQDELVKVGEFKDGVFRRSAGEGRKNQDGFEAVWEHIMGRKLSYPAPRFDDPVFMTYRNFEWRPGKAKGVSFKTLGIFTERETRLQMVRLEPGAAWESPAENAIGLTFVLGGDGTCSGRAYDTYTAIETLAGEAAVFRAASETELLCLVLPMLQHARAVGDRSHPLAAE
jgi:hypothetical protein